MKIFVTGGTGFVGSHVIERLVAAGHEVRALVRSPAKADRLFGKRKPVYVTGDLNDVDAVTKGTRGAEAVIHIAALTAARSAEEFHQVNVAATERLLGVSEGHFLHISSLAAVGPSLPGRPRRATDAAEPVTPYGRSKLSAERAVQAHPGPWTILRPPTVYGPRDTELLRVFKMARLGIAPVFGTGQQELSFVYVEDLADAIVRALSLAPGQAWSVSHQETATARELVETIGRELRGKPPLVVPVPSIIARPILALSGAAAALTRQATLVSLDKAPEFFAPAWIMDPTPFEQATGWKAAMDLAKGIERTASWYRRQGWL